MKFYYELYTAAYMVMYNSIVEHTESDVLSFAGSTILDDLTYGVKDSMFIALHHELLGE